MEMAGGAGGGAAASLAPFGRATAAVSLLLPAATFSDPVGFGGERREDHVRFTVNSGAGRARAVRFGSGTRVGVELGPGRRDLHAERDEWQGVVPARLLLRSAVACDPAAIEVLGEDGDFLARAFAVLDGDGVAERGAPSTCPARRESDHRGRGIAALIGRLCATGEDVLVLAADTPARLRHLAPRLGG